MLYIYIIQSTRSTRALNLMISSYLKLDAHQYIAPYENLVKRRTDTFNVKDTKVEQKRILIVSTGCCLSANLGNYFIISKHCVELLFQHIIIHDPLMLLQTQKDLRMLFTIYSLHETTKSRCDRFMSSLLVMAALYHFQLHQAQHIRWNISVQWEVWRFSPQCTFRTYCILLILKK